MVRRTVPAHALAALLTLGLAGCGSGGHAPAVNDQQAANQIDYAQQIANLPPRSRAGVFLRAVRDAGLECQTIVSQKPHDPVRGYPAWTVQCDNRAPFVLVIQPEGVVQVVPATIDRGGDAGASDG